MTSSVEPYIGQIEDAPRMDEPVVAVPTPVLRKFKVVTGNGSTFEYVAERMDHVGKFIHFYEGDKCVGMCSDYGVRSVSDQPYNQKYVG